MSKMIDLHLLFVSVLSFFFRDEHDSGIVDEHVDMISVLHQISSKFSDTLVGGQVQCQSNDVFSGFILNFASDFP